MQCACAGRYAINRNCRLKYTLDNNSTPTNKSEIKLNPLVWVKYRSQVVVPLIFFLILFVFLSFKYSYWFIFLVLLSLAVNVFYWLRVKEHLKAESTPGIVISIEPPLMAVYSNMSKYGEFYPAIKVESFNNLSNHQIGTRIATASIYTEENEEDHYWNNVHPIPVEYGTKIKKDIERTMSLYSEEQWTYLEKGISDVGANKQVGLYRIMVGESNWENA